MLEKSYILESDKDQNQKSARRLKKSSGLVAQLKTFLNEVDQVEDYPQQQDRNNDKLTGRVLAIDIRYGVASLICE